MNQIEPKPWQGFCYLHTTKSGLPTPRPCDVCRQKGLPVPASTDLQDQADLRRQYEAELQRHRLVDFINSINLPALKEKEHQDQLTNQQLAERMHDEELRKHCRHHLTALTCDRCWLEDVSYNKDIYRTEINKALSKTRAKHHTDLLQLIDFEIWKAFKFYGDRMNPALAYTIAENQAKKYIRELLNEPKTESLSERLEDDRGEPYELSPVEIREDIHSPSSLAPDTIVFGSEQDETEALNTLVEEKFLQLKSYVAVLRGDSRKVGEAILADPGASVRDIEKLTGVPKSTVDRVRKILFAKFGNLLSS